MNPDLPTDTPTAASRERRVLVLGANGRLGRAVVQAFDSAGWQVCAQLRRPPRAALPAGVQLLQCDALDAAALLPAAQGVAIIVNALNPDYTRWATLLPPITDAAVTLARRSGATLMMAGSVYNFGREMPPLLSEQTPFVANHTKAAQRIALERTLADAARDAGVRSIVIRAGDFLGDAGTWLDQAIGKGLAQGRFVQPGPTDLPHAWAWLPDLAATFVRVAELARSQPARLAPHSVLHFAGHTLTGAQLQSAFAQALGRPLRTKQFPWWQLRLAAPFVPMLRALLEMRHLWTRPHQLDGRRLQALIGDQPHTPLPEVAAACLALLGLPGLPAPQPAPQPAVRSAARRAG